MTALWLHLRGLSIWCLREKLREPLSMATQNRMSSGGSTGKEPGILPSGSFLPEGVPRSFHDAASSSPCPLCTLYMQHQVLDIRARFEKSENNSK